MSNPSRLDLTRLLSGNGGVMFENHCLRPELNSMMCDVRVVDDKSPLVDGTTHILVLGQKAMHNLLPETLGNSILEMRGSLFHYKGIPTVCSFLPQDAVDIYKNYEREKNPLAMDFTPDDLIYGDGEEMEEGDVKRLGRTKRTNYAFWLKSDTVKVKQLMELVKVPWRPVNVPQSKYRIFPSSEEVIYELNSHVNQTLYLDLETDFEQKNLQCFAFTFTGDIIYSVPVLDFNYRPAYTDYPRVMQALANSISSNLVVAHNGSCFDFLVLSHKYKIPIGKVYDTLIAMHRCFPDVEKSLGHCTSLWTFEKFHKDEDSVGYHTHKQMTDRMRYCGKDVYTMYLIKQAIDIYAKTIPGLEKSINDAMRCIRPYLISTLTGIKVNEKLVNEKCTENDRLMEQYNRLIEYFIGSDGMDKVREGKKNLGMFSGSNLQCCRYFHELLDYPVAGYGKPNQFGERKPSLGKKNLYKLALKHENPVINLVLAYRETRKETSRLRFLPWVPGRDSTMWCIGGTKTFRNGSRAIFKIKRLIPSTGEIKERGLGGNLANIEKSMREIYIPDGLEI